MDGPWHIDITPWQSWVSSSGSTPLRNQASSRLSGGYLYGAGAALNSSVSWDVPLTAGTWTLTMIHQTANLRGIYSFTLDGVAIGSVDGYSGSTVENVVSTIAGVVVATDAVMRLTFTMASKNASSAGTDYCVAHISLDRTA